MQQDPTPHFTQGFFDNELAVKKGRTIYIKTILMSLLMVLVIIIWGVLPIYWASMFRAPQHVHNMKGLIVVSPSNFMSVYLLTFAHRILIGAKLARRYRRRSWMLPGLQRK